MALERMSVEQFGLLREKISTCSYDMNKHIFYNSEAVAVFKLLRAAFTSTILASFKTFLQHKQETLLSFVRDSQAISRSLHNELQKKVRIDHQRT